MSVLAHEGSALVVILNELRLLKANMPGNLDYPIKRQFHKHAAQSKYENI